MCCNPLHGRYPKSTKSAAFGKTTPCRKKMKISLRDDSRGHRFTYSCHVSWKSVKRKWPEPRRYHLRTIGKKTSCQESGIHDGREARDQLIALRLSTLRKSTCWISGARCCCWWRSSVFTSRRFVLRSTDRKSKVPAESSVTKSNGFVPLSPAVFACAIFRLWRHR